MVELAIADNERFSVSRIEIDGEVSGYTVDTVARLVAADARPRFVLILSAESAAHLPEWHEPERLLDLAEIAVVPRLGYANLPREWLEAHFPGPRRALPVRRDVDPGPLVVRHPRAPRRGRSIRYLVPPAVERYIGEHGLYGADDRPEA